VQSDADYEAVEAGGGRPAHRSAAANAAQRDGPRDSALGGPQVSDPFGFQLFSNDLEGSFVERPNRFVVVADTPAGRIHAHCPNPGRLLEILTPGMGLIFERGLNPARKYSWSLAAARYKGKIVPLISVRANRVTQNLVIPALFPRATGVTAEAVNGPSRFDFRFSVNGETHWAEVKAVSLVEEGVAMFPDAPTPRGLRHVRHLAQIGNGHVIFVIGHPDAREFQANYHADIDFALGLEEVRTQVDIRAVSLSCTEGGIVHLADDAVPVRVAPFPYGPDTGGTAVVADYAPDGGYLIRLENRESKVLKGHGKARSLPWFFPIMGVDVSRVSAALSALPGCSRKGPGEFSLARYPLEDRGFLDVMFALRHQAWR
jgi:sugar fermentation stimulation protein A